MRFELQQVLDSLSSALQQEGLSVCPSMPSVLTSRPSTLAAAIGLGSGESRDSALYRYLGQETDPETQATRELYGLLLSLQLSIDLYAPPSLGSAGCETALRLLHQAVISRLPSGLRVQSLSWDSVRWVDSLRLFHRPVTLSCQALFLASQSEDDEHFRDFFLKGVVSHSQSSS